MTTRTLDRSADRAIPEKAVLGGVLVAIGLITIASYLIAGFGEYALFAVGMVCLVAFALTRAYGYAVAAGIVGGLGAGVIATTLVGDPYDGVAFLLAFAGGFAAVWILGLLAKPRVTNAWPFIPAILFVAVAITVLTETSAILDALVVVGVVALIGYGLKAIRDARKVAPR